jgi:hypothetical protein
MYLVRIFAGRFGNYRACFLVLSAVVACAASVSGQAAQRVVVETSFPPDQPVELVAAEVAGAAHNFTRGETGTYAAAFDAPGDWLRRIALKVRNKTDKVILSATLDGSLAAGVDGEVPMGFNLLFGQEVDESAYTGRRPGGAPNSLAPGQTGDVSWSEAEYAQLERALSTKHPVASYRRMRVFLREVRFADGTVWTLSGLYRIDPLDPRKWTPVAGQSDGAAAAAPALKPGERVVEVSAFAPDSDPDAIAVTGIEVAGRAVTPGQPFAAGDDWLRGLTLRVKNVSPKPITYMQFSLSFPEARYHSGGVGHTLRYGSNAAAGGGNVPSAALLSPGEEAEVVFTDRDLDTFRAFAERLSGPVNFHRLGLGAAFVKFADGTRATIITPARALRLGRPAARND